MNFFQTREMNGDGGFRFTSSSSNSAICVREVIIERRTRGMKEGKFVVHSVSGVFLR